MMMKGMIIMMTMLQVLAGCPYKKAEVMEVSNDTVTIECQGQLYDFYGDGYEVGDFIAVKLIDQQVIDVME